MATSPPLPRAVSVDSPSALGPRALAVRVAKTRVFQFALVALVLYRIAPVAEGPREDVVRISAAEIATREGLAKRASGAAVLGENARDDVRRAAIEDAVLEHEARRMGLAEGDMVVRRRLVQKALFLAEDLGGAFREPTEATLREFHHAHAAEYRIPGHVRFVHVFATRESALAAVRAAVEAHAASRPDEAPPFGEPFPLPRATSASHAELVEQYGPELADHVERAPIGVYAGPVQSKYGFHLVKVLARGDERDSRFEEVATRVAFDRMVDQRERAVDAFVRKGFESTRVEIDGVRVTELPRVRRVAVRDEGSAEDGL